MKRLVPILAALLVAAGCGSEPMPTTPMTPIVRLAAVPGRPAAGYFELRVDGDPGALVAVTSPQAGRIEMHETVASGNVASMRRLERVRVRAGETLSFTAGGRHLMLFDVDPAVRPGGDIVLILNFQHGPPRPLSFSVMSAGGDSH